MSPPRWRPWQHGGFASLGLLLVIVGLSLLVDAMNGGEGRATSIFLFCCSLLAFFVFVGIGMVYFKGPGGTRWDLTGQILFWGGGIAAALAASVGFTLAFTASGLRLRYYGGLLLAIVAVGVWVSAVTTYWRGPLPPGDARDGAPPKD